MGYIINAIKAFVSKEPNEFNEGNLSVAEKKELDEIRKEDKTEAIEDNFLKSLKTNKQKVVELPKRKVYREKFEEKKDIQEKEDSKRDER